MTSFFSFFTLSGKNLDMTFKSKKPMRSKLLNSLINLIKEKLLFNFSFGASFKLKELEKSMSPHTHMCTHAHPHRHVPYTHVHTCSPTEARPHTHLCTHAHPQRHAPPQTHVHTCSPIKSMDLYRGIKWLSYQAGSEGYFPVSGERKSNLHPFSGRQTMLRMAFSFSMICARDG